MNPIDAWVKCMIEMLKFFLKDALNAFVQINRNYFFEHKED